VTQPLHPLDIAVIVVYLAAAAGVGVWASRRAGSSGDQYFLAGRSLPGWLVGISIVATTFAADTPLAISGMVATKGIAANWFWWSMGIAHVGMFLFWSRLWRRSGAVTDADFAERRYGGAAGRGLRSAKAVFFAFLYNAFVLGWVIRAMQKISQPFARWGEWLPEPLWAWLVAEIPMGWLGGPEEAVTILVLIALATLYSTMGGLRGVVITDLFQFGLALIGAFALAYFAVDAAGGLGELVPSLHAVLGPDRAAEVLAFVPPLHGELSYLPIQAFGVYVLIRWWAHPLGDGGGYIAQRLMASRSDDDARLAAGIFVVMHYVVRPWPWILVGLAGLVLFPPGAETTIYAAGAAVAADREMAYPLLAALTLPPGLLGILLASLLAAFMSTIDTHLNWGVSYVAHDLWRGRVNPEASEREIVLVGRVTSVIFAAAAVFMATQISSVEAAWKFVAALGSGMGLPVLLRWIWWRVNAQAEIFGAIGSLTVTVALTVWAPDLQYEFLLAAAVGVGALSSLVAIGWFGPPDQAVLQEFYRRVRPPGLWGPVREGLGVVPDSSDLALSRLAAGWALGAVALVAAMFGPGHALLGNWTLAALDLAVATTAVTALRHVLRNTS
jgi:Na+/proline symporter